ncbi:MAG: hypothetical protein GFH27_549287n3 [Chloroflexi bacterium AL-W]|nr:hypothetical protein [Chloroflexi bacterium AL-W]
MEKVEAEKFMHKAIEVARIGLDNGEVIASAHTQEKSKGRLLVHAKLLALEAADKSKPFSGKCRDIQLFTKSNERVYVI